MRRATTALAATLLLASGAMLSSAGSASAEDCPQGAIAVRYDQLGGAASKLGAPTSCELPTAGDFGRFNTFDRGSIYWSQASGAWDVSGSFRDLWASFGWENSFLRYPTSGEVGIRSGGVFQNYQGGTLYWAPNIAPHSVSGSFLQLYGALGYENGFLGYPTSQETPARGGGVFQTYQGGVMYWSPATGPQAVGGAILAEYGEVGYENGSLGYPTSGEFDIPGGKRTNFQGGYIEWSAATGARVNAPAVGPTPPAPTPPAPTPPAPTPPAPAPPSSAYYASCAAARAAGAAPLYRGQPGYRPGLDRDGDGIACE